MTIFNKMSPQNDRPDPPENAMKIIEKCWNDDCWVYDGNIWWFLYIQTDIFGQLC